MQYVSRFVDYTDVDLDDSRVAGLWLLIVIRNLARLFVNAQLTFDKILFSWSMRPLSFPTLPFKRSLSLTIPGPAVRQEFNVNGHSGHRKTKLTPKGVELSFITDSTFLELLDGIILLEVRQVEMTKLSDGLGSGLEYCQGIVECPEGSI